MDDERPRKRLRKGTKSCVSCRKRRIKCVYEPQNDGVCNDCIIRESNCVEQGALKDQDQSRLNESTRERVERLETLVNGLLDKVESLEYGSKALGFLKTPDTLEKDESYNVESDYQDDEDDDKDDESASGDVAITMTGNSQIRTLFDNDMIALAAGPSETLINVMNGARMPLRTMRARLLALVPSHKDVVFVANAAADWWFLRHCLTSSMHISTREDFIDTYQGLSSPDASPVVIAHWLVCMAICSIQIPREMVVPKTQTWKHRQEFQKRVMRTIECVIISDDVVMGSLESLECAARLVQLATFCGHYKKGWIVLRRIIAIAEMIGLPSAYKQLKATLEQRCAEPAVIKQLEIRADFWTKMCTMDRFFSVLLGLPSVSGSHTYFQDENTELSQRLELDMMRKLSDVTNNVLRRDQMEDEDAAWKETERIVADLDTLEASKPVQWWQSYTTGPFNSDTAPSRMAGFFHRFLVVRANLPYLLKTRAEPRYLPNAVSCLQACRDCLSRWLAAKRSSEFSIFLSRTLDIQAFTASIILTTHRARSMDCNIVAAQHYLLADLELLEQVRQTLRDVPEHMSRDMSKQMIVTLDRLEQCLRGGEGASSRVTLQVPLLGTVTITKREITAELTPTTLQSSSMRSAPPQNHQLSGDQTSDAWLSQQTPGWEFNMSSIFNVPIEFNDIDANWLGLDFFDSWS